MCNVVKKLYRAIRHQQPMLVIKVTSIARCPFKCVLDKAYIVGMSSLEYEIGRGLRPGRVPVNPSGFLGPKQSFRASFHGHKAGATESLRVCQIFFAPAEFGFGLFAFFDIEVNPDPVEDRAVVRSKGLRATKEPAVAAFSIASSKAHLARAAGPQTL
jgi:hypothetical protein